MTMQGVIDDEDYDDEETGHFARDGRKYVEATEAILECQEEIDDDEVVVLSTPKYAKTLHPVFGYEYFVLNYATDRKPMNKYGCIRGKMPSREGAEIIWRRDDV